MEMTLDTAKKTAEIFALIVVPFALFYLGAQIQIATAKRSADVAYTDLAISLLRSTNDTSQLIRDWAVDLLKKSAPEPLPSELEKSLREGKVFLPSDLVTWADALSMAETKVAVALEVERATWAEESTAALWENAIYLTSYVNRDVETVKAELAIGSPKKIKVREVRVDSELPSGTIVDQVPAGDMRFYGDEIVLFVSK